MILAFVVGLAVSTSFSGFSSAIFGSPSWLRAFGESFRATGSMAREGDSPSLGGAKGMGKFLRAPGREKQIDCAIGAVLSMLGLAVLGGA